MDFFLKKWVGSIGQLHHFLFFGYRVVGSTQQNLHPESGEKGYLGEGQSRKNPSAYQVCEYCDAYGGVGLHVVLELSWESATQRIELKQTV